jgi:hypothetical protein
VTRIVKLGLLAVLEREGLSFDFPDPDSQTPAPPALFTGVTWKVLTGEGRVLVSSDEIEP